MTRIILLVAVVCLASGSLMAQEAKELSPRQQAEVALREGRYAEVERWYKDLSKRDRNSAAALYLATLSAINSYQTELAEERMEAYHKLRLKKDHEIAAREEVEAHLSKVLRMLDNTRKVVTNDTLVGSADEVMSQLKLQTAALGGVKRDSYTSPDGRSIWQVEMSEDSLPLFRVYHQLGNGMWDRQNPDEVKITGLPEGAEVSYPFLKSDGSTLYFSVAQSGLAPEQTLGGMDIYVSRYDRAEQKLLVPTQLSMPFNSTFDDFAYIVDEESDLGWMLSNRGVGEGQLRLYTFTPSTLARYEGEAEVVAEAAKWLSPAIVAREMEDVGDDDWALNQLPIYFWVGEKAICSHEDLPNVAAQKVFGEYLTVWQALEGVDSSLGQLRERIEREPSLQQSDSVRGEVLRLEEQQGLYLKRLEALRNEVIRLAGLAIN